MTSLTPYLPLDTVAWPLRKDDGVSSGHCCMASAQRWCDSGYCCMALHKNDIQDLRWVVFF